MCVCIYIFLARCFNYALNHATSFTQYTHLKLNNTIFYILHINNIFKKIKEIRQACSSTPHFFLFPFFSMK